MNYLSMRHTFSHAMWSKAIEWKIHILGALSVQLTYLIACAAAAERSYGREWRLRPGHPRPLKGLNSGSAKIERLQKWLANLGSDTLPRSILVCFQLVHRSLAPIRSGLWLMHAPDQWRQTSSGLNLARNCVC